MLGLPQWESPSPPPMSPRYDKQPWSHMWIEFDGFYFALWGFSPGVTGFPYPQSEPTFDLIWFNLICIELCVCLRILARGLISPSQLLSFFFLLLMPNKTMNTAIIIWPCSTSPFICIWPLSVPWREKEWAAAYVRWSIKIFETCKVPFLIGQTLEPGKSENCRLSTVDWG